MDRDWATEGTSYREVVLDRIQKLLIPDIRSRIRTIFHYTPADFETDLGAHLGSAFSLEPVLTQSAYFRVHNRDDVLSNLYFVGAGTHPGAGIPGVVGSAKATAGLIVG
jgi:phytoene desaturase